MSAINFFGHFFLGVGPGIAFFIFFIANKSFLVLLSLFSSFIWLCVLLFIAAIFRGFYPITEATGSYSGVIIASIVIQEAARYGVWWMHKQVCSTLEAQARTTGHRFTFTDRLYMALAWGFGHGAAHSVFFFVSLLPLTSGDTAWYAPACPSMSLLLSGALYSLAFGMILTSAMVVSFDGLHTRKPLHVAYAPALHAAAGLLTVANLDHGGCLVTMPVLLGLGTLSMAYASVISWKRGGQMRVGPAS